MADDPYDVALAEARTGCCGDRRKPCSYHEGWADGYEQCQADNWRPSGADVAVMGGWEADGTLPSVTPRDIQHPSHELARASLPAVTQGGHNGPYGVHHEGPEPDCTHPHCVHVRLLVSRYVDPGSAPQEQTP